MKNSRPVSIRRLASRKRFAPRGLVPLPVFKSAPTPIEPVVQVANATNMLTSIANLLRGSIALSPVGTKPAEEALLSLN